MGPHSSESVCHILSVAGGAQGYHTGHLITKALVLLDVIPEVDMCKAN